MTSSHLVDFVRQNPIPGLGRGCLLVGAVMLFSSAAFMAAWTVIEPQWGEGALRPAVSSSFISYSLAHSRTLALSQAGVGVATALVGVCALRPRPWARGLVEALAWLALGGTVIYGPLVLYSWHQAPVRVFTLVLVGGSVVIITWSVRLVRFIRFVRSASVRTAFQLS